ncbi:MAG: ABC transporter ATP-binding protein [Desulfurococcales archaeon]|nr:ABC transporter ATP-binding protein [Desulfurococcales archaeon]
MRPCIGGIKLREVVTGYPKGFRLGPITMDIPEGSIYVLAGPNASGKTTMLRLIAGILKVLSGELIVCGHTHKEMWTRRSLIAYVPAYPQADPLATPRELIEVSGGTLEKALEYIPEIVEFIDTKMYMLSSGQRRLACIARALSTDSSVLLIDEPTSFLDVARQTRILGLLRAISRREGTTIVLAMHELHLIPLIADYVAILSSGKVVKQGKPEEILEKPLLERIYNARLAEASISNRRILLPSPAEDDHGS